MSAEGARVKPNLSGKRIEYILHTLFSGATMSYSGFSFANFAKYEEE